MQELQKQATTLDIDVAKAVDQLHIDQLEAELRRLQTVSGDADFWADNLKAQEIMQEISRLDSRVTPWRRLQQELTDIRELLELNDTSLEGDLKKQLNQATAD